MYGSVEGLFILNGDLGISYVNLFIKSKDKSKIVYTYTKIFRTYNDFLSKVKILCL